MSAIYPVIEKDKGIVVADVALRPILAKYEKAIEQMFDTLACTSVSRGGDICAVAGAIVAIHARMAAIAATLPSRCLEGPFDRQAFDRCQAEVADYVVSTLEDEFYVGGIN